MFTDSLSPLPVMPVVLLLEDNADLRRLITDVMSAAGFEVCAVPDGRRVMEILRERSVDLVITDVAMPEKDGLETMTELRFTHPRLPVIAMSGDVPVNMDLYLTLADKLGASRVMAKPFRMPELIAAAREVLATSTAA